jgi:hypothetical protein
MSTDAFISPFPFFLMQPPEIKFLNKTVDKNYLTSIISAFIFIW